MIPYCTFCSERVINVKIFSRLQTFLLNIYISKKSDTQMQSSTYRSKAINTYEELVKNEKVTIVLNSYNSVHTFFETSTDPVFMVWLGDKQNK
jgi:adenine-specific DNA methylase